MFTEADKAIIVEAVQEALNLSGVAGLLEVCALCLCILVGSHMYRNWWYAKNNRDFY